MPFSITVQHCSCDVDSRQDEKHHAELSSRLRIVCGQEDDAVREHRACEVSSTAYLLSLNSVRVVSEVIHSSAIILMIETQ